MMITTPKSQPRQSTAESEIGRFGFDQPNGKAQHLFNVTCQMGEQTMSPSEMDVPPDNPKRSVPRKPFGTGKPIRPLTSKKSFENWCLSLSWACRFKRPKPPTKVCGVALGRLRQSARSAQHNRALEALSTDPYFDDP